MTKKRPTIEDNLSNLQQTADSLREMESTLTLATTDPEISHSDLSKLAQGLSSISRLRVDVLCKLINYESELKQAATETQGSTIARFPTMPLVSSN